MQLHHFIYASACQDFFSKKFTINLITRFFCLTIITIYYIFTRMKPLEYIKKHERSINAFAKKSGVSSVTLWRIFTGRITNPQLKNLQRIINASDGHLRYEDFTSMK